ncbi:LysE family translocator [Enemella dayhoffiae]|nr:LysE family translocator [Enemella dayhoffiae]
MSWEFLIVVLAVIVTPGADFVVTLRSTVAGGRAAGTGSALGVGTASMIQGALVSVGLGSLIVQSQPIFTTLKWLGILYLAFLAVQSLRSAWRGRYADLDTGAHGSRGQGFRNGFLCNITNPKMFVFYLSLLPQFVGVHAPVWSWLVHASVLPLAGTCWLLGIVVLAGAVRERLLRPLTRRIIDAASGIALLGFSARLALQRD